MSRHDTEQEALASRVDGIEARMIDLVARLAEARAEDARKVSERLDALEARPVGYGREQPESTEGKFFYAPWKAWLPK